MILVNSARRWQLNWKNWESSWEYIVTRFISNIIFKPVMFYICRSDLRCYNNFNFTPKAQFLLEFNNFSRPRLKVKNLYTINALSISLTVVLIQFPTVKRLVNATRYIINDIQWCSIDGSHLTWTSGNGFNIVVNINVVTCDMNYYIWFYISDKKILQQGGTFIWIIQDDEL